MQKIKLVSLFLCVVMLLGLAAGCTAPTAQKGGETVAITVEVTHKDGSVKAFELETAAENLEDALTEAELVEGTTSEYGLYIQTVDGETADEGAQEWWCLMQNDESLLTGAGDTAIADGETYQLKFMIGW